MSSIEFRPTNELKQYHELLYESLVDYCNSDMKSFRSECCEDIKECPACGHYEISNAFHNGPIHFKTCQKCKTIFQSPSLTQKYLTKWYYDSIASNFSESIRKSTYLSRKNSKFLQIFQRYREYFEKGVLLDIGCSYGYFLELIREKTKMTVEGIELNNETVQWVINNKGYTVYNKDIRELKPVEYYDTITCWGTVTHIKEPFTFFSTCFEALKKGGTILISTPNCRGIEFIINEFYEGVQITGQSFFSKDGIKSILERCGYKDISILCNGKRDIDILCSMIERKPKSIEKVSVFMQDLLLDKSEEGEDRRREFQNFITKNQISSYMEIVASK